MFNIGAIILGPSDGILVCDPSLNILNLAVELKQFLRLDEFPASSGSQLQQVTVLGLEPGLRLTNVVRVKVTARHQTVTQRRQRSDLLVEVLHVQFDRIQLLQQSLPTHTDTRNVNVTYNVTYWKVKRNEKKTKFFLSHKAVGQH